MPPPYDPFANYACQKFCPLLDKLVSEMHCDADVAVAKPFAPDIQLVGASETTIRTLANIPGFKYVLGSSRDLFAWKDSAEDFPRHFQGRLGERVLTVILEALVRECVSSSRAAGFPEFGGKVLREKRHYREGRGDIVYWNNELVLKFQRRTTFKLLQKIRGGSHEFRYRQESPGLELTEIDGLAYLHVNGHKYLVVGEVKTRVNPNSDMWRNVSAAHGAMDIRQRLLAPLKSLYPDHALVYAITGYESSLFASERGSHRQLHDGCADLVEQLRADGVIPLVCVIKNIDCTQLAQKFYRQLIITKETIKELDRSRYPVEEIP